MINTHFIIFNYFQKILYISLILQKKYTEESQRKTGISAHSIFCNVWLLLCTMLYRMEARQKLLIQGTQNALLDKWSKAAPFTFQRRQAIVRGRFWINCLRSQVEPLVQTFSKIKTKSPIIAVWMSKHP